MSDLEEFCSKYTANYRSPDDINNFKIRITLKELQTNPEYATITQTFKWQEKKFARHEIEFYKDEKNCITDLEKQYNEQVSNVDENDGLIFSYTNQDSHALTEESLATGEMQQSELAALANRLALTENEGESSEEETDACDDRKLATKAFRNPCQSTGFETLYIMADMGEYVEETWIKSEYVLCTIKYDKRRKILSLYPDFSENKPYLLSVETEITRNFVYFFEDASEKMSTDLFLKHSELENKITSLQLEQKHKILGDKFEILAKNKLDVHFFVEICTGRNFEYDDIYVQYLIDLPSHWSCSDTSALRGTTQTSRANDVAFFGHTFDVCLTCDLRQLDNNGVPPAPYIYFEVISKDTWSRFRTEGLTYTQLPVCQPGKYTRELNCFRLSPRGPCANLRRFFIGDCSSYDEITWIGIPRDYLNGENAVLNKFGVDTVATGQILVRMNVVHQSQALLDGGGAPSGGGGKKFSLEKLRVSALVKSVEQVVIAFKRAKRRMMEARENV